MPRYTRAVSAEVVDRAQRGVARVRAAGACAEAGDVAALLVDRDQDVVALRAQLGGEGGELFGGRCCGRTGRRRRGPRRGGAAASRGRWCRRNGQARRGRTRAWIGLALHGPGHQTGDHAALNQQEEDDVSS